MKKKSFSSRIFGLLKFLGLSLLFSVGLAAIAALWSWITGFSGTLWSERTFWLSLLTLLIAALPALAALNDKTDYRPKKPEDLEKVNILTNRREKTLKAETPGRIALRLISTGILGLVFSALIEYFTR